MIRNILLCTLLCFFGGLARAQLKGVVFGSNKTNKETIYGAKLRLLHDGRGVITGEDGKFEMILPKNLPDTLVITAMGYYPDTVIVDKADRFIAMEIILYSDQLLPEVVVSQKRETHSISRLKTLHVEEITSGELRKAACCNLSESFETNASVDVNMTDAVSGAKKIQMMGLDGVYTQLQMENIPYLRGLESAFGLNSMSGTWIESIQITKGTGNVVNGYESMAGLVNLEVKKPKEMEKLYLNMYVNGMGRTELNFNSGFEIGKKWHSGWLAHGAIHPIEMDYNGDGFRDMPNGYNAAVMNRYQYHGEKMEAQFGFNTYLDFKEGGQISSFRNSGTPYYDVVMDSKHADVFAKTGFFLKKPEHSIGVVYNAKYQLTDAQFGLRKFSGEERRAYVNMIYDGIFGNTDHRFKAGLNGVYIFLDQQLDSLHNDREEIVPGAFFEYTYTGSRLSGVLGVREDYHNLFGFQFSPRVHLKYILTEWTDVRATAGKGWRVPNYMIDNISLLASSRQWVAPSETLPEISWNMGGSVVQRFKMGKRQASLTVDFYHTRFENQLIVDSDLDPHKVVFTNVQGKSWSNSLQAEVSIPVGKTIDLRFAYKYLDVRAPYGNEIQQKMMIPAHRGFFNIAYATRNKRWEYDLTCSVYGNARLPMNALSDSTFTSDTYSPVFPLVNAQITHVYKRWDFYLGGENILNYRQSNPIIDAENPFGSFFDATRVWAPVFGINVYFGVRFSIAQKHTEDTH
jgi:outer membrane cobalamin receptor